MKNIHILPTDKRSRLWTNNLRRRLELDEFPSQHPFNIAKHIYITSDKEIKEWDWFLSKEGIVHNNWGWNFGDKKIILTTDQDLIKNGVQAIDNEFLGWFVNNPSCEEVETKVEFIQTFDNLKDGFYYKIIIPKEEQKQHLIDMMQGDEELGLYDDSTIYAHNNFNMHETNNYQALKQGYEAGAIEMAKRRYSEEEVKKLIINFLFERGIGREVENVKEWFEQFKKR